MTDNKINVTLDVTLEDLTQLEKEVLGLIRSNSKISRSEIASLISRNVRTVQRITNSLVSKGYILRLGNNRFGYWEPLK